MEEQPKGPPPKDAGDVTVVKVGPDQTATIREDANGILITVRSPFLSAAARAQRLAEVARMAKEDEPIRVFIDGELVIDR